MWWPSPEVRESIAFAIVRTTSIVLLLTVLASIVFSLFHVLGQSPWMEDYFVSLPLFLGAVEVHLALTFMSLVWYFRCRSLLGGDRSEASSLLIHEYRLDAIISILKVCLYGYFLSLLTVVFFLLVFLRSIGLLVLTDLQVSIPLMVVGFTLSLAGILLKEPDVSPGWSLSLGAFFILQPVLLAQPLDWKLAFTPSWCLYAFVFFHLFTAEWANWKMQCGVALILAGQILSTRRIDGEPQDDSSRADLLYVEFSSFALGYTIFCFGLAPFFESSALRWARVIFHVGDFEWAEKPPGVSRSRSRGSRRSVKESPRSNPEKDPVESDAV